MQFLYYFSLNILWNKKTLGLLQYQQYAWMKNVVIQKIRRYFSSKLSESCATFFIKPWDRQRSHCVRCVSRIWTIWILCMVCDCCLQWVHLNCIGKRTVPKGKLWICGDRLPEMLKIFKNFYISFFLNWWWIKNDFNLCFWTIKGGKDLKLS